MGMMIKISNTLQLSSQNQEVADHLDQIGETWSSYVTGDLQQRNELNNKKLGGQEPRQKYEEEEQTFEPMESIMDRFSNFS